MNSIFLSISAFIIGIIWMASEPIKSFLLENGYDIIPEDDILVAIVAILSIIVSKRIYLLIAYTDEVLPLYLSLLGLALTAGGVFVFTRLILLGGLCLIASAYWSKGIINSYYR